MMYYSDVTVPQYAHKLVRVHSKPGDTWAQFSASLAEEFCHGEWYPYRRLAFPHETFASTLKWGGIVGDDWCLLSDEDAAVAMAAISARYVAREPV
jgi:hypothetical protein